MSDEETDFVTKFDSRQIKAWMDTLKKVLPIIPSKDGFILDKSGERLVLHFLLGKDPINEGVSGISANEAFALAALLENFPTLINSILSQQKDFVMVRRMLQESLIGLSSKKLEEAKILVQETSYIEGNK